MTTDDPNGIYEMDPRVLVDQVFMRIDAAVANGNPREGGKLTGEAKP